MTRRSVATIAAATFALGVAVGNWFPPAPATAGKTVAVVPFRCPMHSWITAEAPGKCTVCGMSLVRDDGSATEAAGLPATVMLEPATTAVIGVQTVSVARQPLVRTLRVAGTIEVDAARRKYLTAWADGRIEKLFVNAVGAEIRAGEPLLALFSRDVLAAQQELLQLARIGPNAAASMNEQRARLTHYGLTNSQVDALLASGEPSSTPVIQAPQSGTVIAKEVEEGQWVRTGDRLFEIADFSRGWFVFEVPAFDRDWVRVGQEVQITVGTTTLVAPVTFIDPNLNPASRGAWVRAEFENRPAFPRGALAVGRVATGAPAVLAVPRSAVLDAGAGPVAWVERAASTYELRVLSLGRRGDTLVEVLAGLVEGERVVVHAALLIDAQAQLTRQDRR